MNNLRDYQRTENGITVIATVSKDADGNLSFRLHSGQCFEPTKLDHIFAEMLFDTEVMEILPHLNLDAPPFQDRDIIEYIKLPPYFSNSLAGLARKMNCYDLQLPSHQEHLQEILDLARQWRELGIQTVECERRIEQVLCPTSAIKDSEEPLFFDCWSEGPFTLSEVERFVAKRPEAAKHYHTSHQVTYADYIENPGKAQVDQPSLTPSHDQLSTKPWYRKFFDLAASILSGILVSFNL